MSESDGDRHGDPLAPADEAHLRQRDRHRDLIAVLRRVRRRLRLRRALDAAVLGGTVALAIATLLAALQLGGLVDAASLWVGQPLAGRLGMLVAGALLGGALGAGAVLARRGAVELAAAATTVDRWLDRQGRGDRGPAPGDRARVALALGDSPSPFARAAVADAAERAAAVPVRAAAPLRRPRRLGALAIAAACGLVAAVAPLMAPTAATGRRPGGTVVAGSAGPLADALSEVQAIGRAARARGDHELAALADELGQWLARAAQAAAAGRGVPAAEGELAAIAARARRSAEEGAQAAAVLARVAAALSGTEAARPLGQAFAGMDAEAIAREARAAGAAAGSAAALSEALARAAEAARTDAGGSEPRRLSGLGPEAAPARPGVRNQAGGAPAGPPERRLRRLERDLRESADACAADPRRCGRELDARANDLAAPAREAAGAEGRERLARAAEQLRDGIGAGRGEAGPAGGERHGQPGTARSGIGERGREPGQASGSVRSGVASGGAMAEAAGQGAASPARAGGAAAGAATDEAAAAAARQAFEQAARGASSAGGPGSDSSAGGTGEGAGSGEAGGGPAQPPGAAAAGPRVELSIPEGAGPTRAEAIRTGAGRGFAQPGYAPVFRDYQAAMEDGLEHTEIPAERRQLVRRYFELIRPR